MKDFLNVNNSTMRPQYNISFKKLISDSARNFYDWLFGKCNTLDIQNKVLGNYLVKLHEDYKDTYSFIKKLRSIKSTDEFKNLFPYTSYSDYNNSIHNIIVKHDFVFSKYIFEEYCDIHQSFDELFDTICSVTFQSEIIIPSRIPALLGDAGSGKSYITCELFPYYMSKKIKGHLYHAVVNCATVKSGKDILFKWDSSRSNKIIVGAVGEAIIRSNECDNVDDFFLVTLDNYNGMLKRDEDELFSFINNIGSTITVADKIYKSIANFNIIINGRLKK